MKNQVFNSWEIINEMTIIKKADWSFFKYNGSGIPKATRNYWNINNLSSGEKLHIILNYKGVEYESYIVIDLKSATIIQYTIKGRFMSR